MTSANPTNQSKKRRKSRQSIRYKDTHTQSKSTSKQSAKPVKITITESTILALMLIILKIASVIITATSLHKIQKNQNINKLFKGQIIVSIIMVICVIILLIQEFKKENVENESYISSKIILIWFIVTEISFIYLFSQQYKYSMKKNKAILVIYLVLTLLPAQIIALILLIMAAVKLYGVITQKEEKEAKAKSL